MKKIFLVVISIFILLMSAVGFAAENNNLMDLNKQAQDAYDAGDFQKALTISTSIIDADAKSTDAYYIRGRSYMGVGKYNEAVADLNKVIEVAPGFVIPYVDRANAYMALQDYKKAFEEIC